MVSPPPLSMAFGCDKVSDGMDSTVSGTVQYAFRRPRFSGIYDTEHRHSALGLMTPHDIHNGLAEAKWQPQAAVLPAAYAVHLGRFPRRVPVPPPLPTTAWINKPLAYVARRMERVDLMHS